MAFSLWPLLHYSLSLFHASIVKRMMKRRRLKSRPFLTMTITQGKYFCFYETVSLSIHTISFLCPKLEGNNKTGKTKSTCFFDHGESASKNISALLRLSLFHPPTHILSFMLFTQRQLGSLIHCFYLQFFTSNKLRSFFLRNGEVKK